MSTPVLCLLPFEPDERASSTGRAAIYIGHPLIERIADFAHSHPAIERPGRTPMAPEILLLPEAVARKQSICSGSFGEAQLRLAAGAPPAQFILPAVEHLAERSIESAVMAWPTRARIVTGEEAEAGPPFRRARGRGRCLRDCHPRTRAGGRSNRRSLSRG